MSHSDKALKTLSLLDTVAGAWKQCDIKWVREERMVPGQKKCPTCEGNRYAPVPKSLAGPEPGMPWRPATVSDVVPRPEGMSPYDYLNRFRYENGLVSVQCPGCWNPRKRYSSGTVPALVKAKVWVGYPQWPTGTRFDSRFRTTETDRYCCELCSKTLKGAYSPRIPVHGTDSKGISHGMWVGEDCAKKFLPGVHTRIIPNNDEKHKGEQFVLE